MNQGFSAPSEDADCMFLVNYCCASSYYISFLCHDLMYNK